MTMPAACRVCRQPLPADRLLRFDGMPAAAQFMPDATTVAQDKAEALDIYQCGGCGLVQTGNAPVPYYRDVVRAAAFSDEMRAFRRRQFAAFVEKYGLRDKKVVEIGCGRGEYLALLAEAGIAAHGVEHAEDAVRQCMATGLRVQRGFVDRPDCRLADAPFDGFVVLNFLEHWPDPNGALAGIGHNLTPGGIGLVEVPNFDMILRRRLFAEFIRDHVFYFTRETLETTLRLNGFEVIECAEVWHDYILSAVVRKRAPCATEPFERARLALKMEIDAFVSRHRDRGVAIWGAGHQALATIALLRLGADIRYVVDSAPFKQGRFTPTSHLPIVSPEQLRSDAVGAIIVMAASYSDEVAKTIRRDFGTAIAVTILRDAGLETVA